MSTSRPTTGRTGSAVSRPASGRTTRQESQPETPPPPMEMVPEEVEEEKDEKCCSGFRKVVHGIWRTRMTEDTDKNRELYIKTTLRELIVYCIFLIVLMILTFGMTSSTMYYYTKVLSELFLDGETSDPKVSFRTSNDIAKWWRFSREPLINGIFWDTWYNNEPNATSLEKNFIFYENKLLGVPRVRQLRVRNDSCKIASEFRNDIRTCFDMYSKRAEDRATYGYGNSTAWIYSSSEALNGRAHSGQMGTYEGGGYYIDFSRNKTKTLNMIDELFTGLWIDRATRVVFIDFTIYNANINLFCVVKLIMEFPATGGALPSWDFRTVKLLRYVEPMDYFVLACECIFMVFILYYIIEEIIEIKRHKLSYFKSFWNWLDVIVISIAIVCAGFNIYRTLEVNEKLTTLLADEDRYPDFDFLSYWQQHFNHAIAITVFFAWVKIFKYISFNKTMTQLSSTLGACAKDLLGFSVMFFIIFCAFAQLGYLIFGTKVNDFREFQHSVFTLFRIILGDFNFNDMYDAHHFLGPLFFMLYVFFVFFVLINMFLAIINDTYSEVKTDLTKQGNEFEMTDFFRQRAGKFLNRITSKRDMIADIQEAMQIADTNKDHKLDFDEWRNQLKTRGYADGEIEAMFSKYDEDGDRILDEEELKRMHAELEGQKAALSEQIDDVEKVTAASNSGLRDATAGDGDDANREVTEEEFLHLARRVDNMEVNVNSIVVKIDLVLCKLEEIERAKLHRRETMRKLLDAISEADESKEVEQMVRKELHSWEEEKDTSSAPSTSSLRK